MPADLLKTLSDLVALPSVNPMGRDVAGPIYFEHQVTDYLQQFFERLRVPWFRQPVAPLRDNIIARLDGNVAPEAGGPVVLFEAHQDTVPVTGMTIDPFGAEVRDGRIYGRGACDIKGGMAAMLTAFARLADERPADMPNVLMVCTVGEEFGFLGAKALAGLLDSGNFDGNAIPRPDVAIVSEPTELDVVVAHKGVVRWRCHTHGRASHSSQPQLGESAIFRMAQVLEAIEIYQHDVVGTLGQHRLCGQPTISVGTIDGGISVNTVPDHATIEIDRRCLPGEQPRAAYDHAVNYLRNCLAGDPAVRHDEPFSESFGLNDEHNGQLADQLRTIVRQSIGRCELVGVPYGTDAATIADVGIPTVVFGPGSIAQAHTADEWIAIDQLEQATEIYYQFARSATIT